MKEGTYVTTRRQRRGAVLELSAWFLVAFSWFLGPGNAIFPLASGVLLASDG